MGEAVPGNTQGDFTCATFPFSEMGGSDHRARRGPGCRKNLNHQAEDQTHGLLLRLFLSMRVVGVNESYFGRDVQ